MLIKEAEFALKNGDTIAIEEKGYSYEGADFIDMWKFDGGLDGGLTMSYHPAESVDIADIGDGFVGTSRNWTPLKTPA